MPIKQYSAVSLPRKILVQVQSLFEPSLGIITRDLVKLRVTECKEAWITVITHRARVIAWALSTTRSLDCGMFQCYVVPEMRRQGLGTWLWRYNQERHPGHEFGYFSWDKTSTKFFNKVAK